MGEWLRIAVWSFVSVLRSRRDLALENVALRQPLMVLHRQPGHVRLKDSDRLFCVWFHRLWPGWRYCERLIGSIRRECLDHVIVRGEQHLLRVLRGYASYYHAARTHRSLENDCPDPRPVEPPEVGDVVVCLQVGGLHHRYGRRLAA